MLGLLGGALLGGAGVWWWLSVRLRRLEEERADLQRTLRERENEAFRDAPSADAPPRGETADEENDDHTRLRAEKEQLEDENAELREQNETLKTKITEIKEHLRALREAE